MNIDLIIKLAKLANENTNDNEANAAARKVCRLIKEGNYQFGLELANPIKPGTTWNDLKRNDGPPPWSSKRPTTPRPDFHDWFVNMYTENHGQEKSYDSETNGTYEYHQYTASDQNERVANAREKRERRRQVPKRPLECTRCHKEFITGYVGNLFKCDGCFCAEYNETKQQKKQEV